MGIVIEGWVNPFTGRTQTVSGERHDEIMNYYRSAALLKETRPSIWKRFIVRLIHGKGIWTLKRPDNNFHWEYECINGDIFTMKSFNPYKELSANAAATFESLSLSAYKFGGGQTKEDKWFYFCD